MALQSGANESFYMSTVNEALLLIRKDLLNPNRSATPVNLFNETLFGMLCPLHFNEEHCDDEKYHNKYLHSNRNWADFDIISHMLK